MKKEYKMSAARQQELQDELNRKWRSSLRKPAASAT